MASTATSALEAQRRRLLAERDKMRSKAKPRATSSSSAPPPFLQPRTLSAGPPGLSIGDADDAPSVADLKLFVDHLLPATTPSHGMRPPSLALLDRAGHALCFQRDAFVAWVLQYMHALPVSLAVKRSPPPILLNHLVRAQLVSDIGDGWYSLRAPPTEVACPMPSKAVLAQQLLEMDVAKELARDISVVLQPPSTRDEAMRDDVPRLTFGLCITLRDTTWTIQRCIGQFARMYATARESMDLPPFAGVRLEHARLVDVHDELNGILQRVVRAPGPWAHADFTTFFDNSLGYLALLTNAKALHDRLDGSATTIAALTAQIKQLEATVGRQSTLIHTLSSSKPATATKSFSAFESGAFPSLLLPSSGDTYSSCAVWENTSNGLFSASRHSTHGPSTSMAACAATAACAWVPANTLPCAVDMRLGRIVSMLAPTPSAVCHRFKACNVVASMVKRVLGAQAFVTGVSAARMFLPDCQLKMSVFFPPPHSSSSSNTTPSDKPLWYMKLNEALCVASSSAPCADDLMIRNVELVHDTSAPKLRCCVGKVSVLIDYGAVHDVRNACFLEAMDRLIGKNHLFKRSVLLAQGWLVYESGTNVSITDYKLSALLSTHTVAVLMLYVFNLFHTSLHHPLQAVGRFFGTYSSFPWDDFCVSIDGPRDLSCLLKMPKPPCHARDLLLQPATLQEFRSCHLATSVPDDYDAEMSNKMLRFEVKSFNVMDPLDPASNLGGNVTAKEATTIRTAFDQGASKIHQVLLALKKEMSSSISTSLGSSSSVSLLDTCFPNIWKRFQCGWRPDSAATNLETTDSAISNDVMMSLASLGLGAPATAAPESEESVDPLCGDEDALRCHVLMCDFLLNGHVTPHAVFTKTVAILNEKGPLPIGEIGKCLQDATANSTLSVALKEQFGGLKKFLEQYPADFLISDDHPFNPKVYVQSHLLDENRATCEQNKKKHKCSRRKKAPKPEAPKASKVPNASAPVFVPSGVESSLKLESPAFVPKQQPSAGLSR